MAKRNFTRKDLDRILEQEGYGIAHGDASTKSKRFPGGQATNRTLVQGNKYNAKKCEYDGYKFDSQAERDRYIVLKDMQDKGEISELQLQPRYLLQKAFADCSGRRHKAIEYVGDFAYVQDGKTICEDVKGFSTQVYRIKIKIAIRKYPHVEFRKVER